VYTLYLPKYEQDIIEGNKYMNMITLRDANGHHEVKSVQEDVNDDWMMEMRKF